MKHLIGRSHSRVLALGATCFALLVAASPAAAAGNHCAKQSAAPVFSQFGDSAQYAALTGKVFAGWTLHNAALVAGGEPWQVSGSDSAHSLQIAAGGFAASPAFCVDDSLPYWRFFAQSGDPAQAGKLYVLAQWSDGQGHSGIVPDTVLSASDYASWTPTPPLILGSVLPANVTVNVRLLFYAAGGAWSIDDVYVDPYAKG